MARLKDKVAIVTGGSAGIGEAVARLFVKEGAKVVLTDIDTENGKKIASELGEDNALFVQHDVSKEAEWEEVVEKAKEKFGKIDVLVNNAGIYKIIPLESISVEEWNQLMDINVTGVFLGMKHVIPEIVKEGKGSVVNLSSVAGLIGASAHALYGASKGAVRIMSKDIAAEFAKKQVRVNTVHPGYIKTKMAEYASETTGLSSEELDAGYPLGHMGDVDDVAYAVLFLASDESKFITGTELVVDGGMTTLPNA